MKNLGNPSLESNSVEKSMMGEHVLFTVCVVTTKQREWLDASEDRSPGNTGTTGRTFPPLVSPVYHNQAVWSSQARAAQSGPGVHKPVQIYK